MNSNNKEKIIYNKFGWIDLSMVKMRGSLFDWIGSIGISIPFQYKDITSHLIITGKASQQNVYIDIPNYTSHYSIAISQLKYGQLGGALNKFTSEYRYNIGDTVNDVLILGRYIVNDVYKYYNYKCLKDGYIGNVREDHLITGNICPVCVNKVVMAGVNDVATTCPDIASLLLYPSDKLKYTANSSKKTYFKCPRCGNIIYASFNHVYRCGLQCSKCSDGISYPNKFVYNFIEQVSNLYLSKGYEFKFKTEKSFDWSTNYQHRNKKLSGKKIYDMYIYDYNIIIENQGEYHYKNNKFNGLTGSRTLEEVLENDIIKKNLALSNGIQESHYIVLDCAKSNMDYIKASIMSSNLPNLLGFTEDQIDWNECNKFATSSRVYEACELWNNSILTKQEIADKMHMNKSTVNTYIKRGQELGIINV